MKVIFLLLQACLVSNVYAGEALPKPKPPQIVEAAAVNTLTSLYAEHSDWTFSGIVNNENTERYAYYLQISRNGQQFHAVATLLDIQQQSILLYEEGDAEIKTADMPHWQIGAIFLRYNPINNSWVFGVKDENKKGFNFKVDTLNQMPVLSAHHQTLKPGLEFLMEQTGALNGHYQMDNLKKDQFVTAKRTWFRQVWSNKPLKKDHTVTHLLCEFNDGRSVYSTKLPDKDALRGTIVGFRDKNNQPTKVSQFVKINHDKDDKWLIQLSMPNLSVSFENLLKDKNSKDQLVTGVTKKGEKGFCTVTQDTYL